MGLFFRGTNTFDPKSLVSKMFTKSILFSSICQTTDFGEKGGRDGGGNEADVFRRRKTTVKTTRVCACVSSLSLFF